MSMTIVNRTRQQRCTFVAVEAAAIAKDAHLGHQTHCRGYRCDCKRSLRDLLEEARLHVDKSVRFNKGDLNAMLKLAADRHNWEDQKLFEAYKFRAAHLMDVSAVLADMCGHAVDPFGGQP